MEYNEIENLNGEMDVKSKKGKKIWPDDALDKKRSTVSIPENVKSPIKSEMYFDGNKLKPKHFKRIKKVFGDNENVKVIIEL